MEWVMDQHINRVRGATKKPKLEMDSNDDNNKKIIKNMDVRCPPQFAYTDKDKP